MRLHSSLSRLLVATTVLSLSTVISALPKVTRGGRYLYSEDGTRFYIKGIAYQEQGALSTDPNAPFAEPTEFFDPLSDAAACARDVPFLQQLSVNTIRVYSVNASLDHDACMEALNAAGIYTIIDLSLPVNGSLDRSAPSWSTNLLNLYINTIDVFAKYDNVLAYNVGNEVATTAEETSTGAFIKAAARDVKAYLRSKSLDHILVAYAAINADRTWLDPFANYLSCGSDDTSLDLFGINNYEWCGDSSFEASYAGIQGHFAGYNIPLYFSEFGCNTSPPRLWTEVQAIFSETMSPVWSGGLAFSYFPAQSDAGEFGMVTISGSTVTVSEDFTRLVTQYSTATGPNTPSQADAGSTTFPACPAENSTFFASTTLPPTPNDAACKCMVDNLSCRFTPQTTNTSVIVGELINSGCSLLGGVGGTCNDIASSGSAGTYGPVAQCSPDQKLSYVMSQYYELTAREATSCDFSGNATVNANAPSSSDAVNSAVSQCLTSTTFTPTAPSSDDSGSNGGSGGTGTGTPRPSASDNAAAGSLLGSVEGLTGMSLMLIVAVASGFLTLA